MKIEYTVTLDREDAEHLLFEKAKAELPHKPGYHVKQTSGYVSFFTVTYSLVPGNDGSALEGADDA